MMSRRVLTALRRPGEHIFEARSERSGEADSVHPVPAQSDGLRSQKLHIDPERGASLRARPLMQLAKEGAVGDEVERGPVEGRFGGMRRGSADEGEVHRSEEREYVRREHRVSC